MPLTTVLKVGRTTRPEQLVRRTVRLLDESDVAWVGARSTSVTFREAARLLGEKSPGLHLVDNYVVPKGERQVEHVVRWSKKSEGHGPLTYFTTSPPEVFTLVQDEAGELAAEPVDTL